jgi:hypothetical protein
LSRTIQRSTSPFPTIFREAFDIDDTVFNLIGNGNTIFNHLSHAPDSLGTVNNFFTDNPMLGSLADNGGPTLTHRPLAGSPVIDQGSNDLADVPFSGIPLTYDQRGSGFGRFVDVPSVNNNGNNFIVDIGAVEFDTATPPKVINVTISSWSATNPHTPHSFNNLADNLNDFDGSGIQLRTVPVGNIDTVSIQFSELVVVAATDFLFRGLTKANTFVANQFTPPSAENSFTATWLFADPIIIGDYYLVSLSDDITNLAGTHLDGDWTNPGRLLENPADPGDGYFDENGDLVSEFPSGNGSAGGDFNFVLTILPGDATLDLSIDTADLIILLNQFFAEGNFTFQEGNFNGNSQIDTTDLLYVLNQFFFDLGALYIAADFNGDFVVDVLDQGIWQENAGTGTTHAEGDASGDGEVNGLDFRILQRQFLDPD